MRTLIVLFFAFLLCLSCEENVNIRNTQVNDARKDSLHTDSVKTTPGGGVHIDIEIDTTENADTVEFEIG